MLQTFDGGIINDQRQKNTLMRTMADNLPTLRSKLNLSQGELATIFGVTRQTISAFESNQRKMTCSVFLALILILFRNEPTKRLLAALNIYTTALNDFLNISKYTGGNENGID